MPARPARALALLLAAAVLAGLSGCASAPLKGTPFYTGEYEKRAGPAEDRVNLWPLLYYRNPALSVLWPVFEHTDEHAAIRPLFSVYRLHEPQKEYNVLWPLAQFDRKHADNRIFPVYWGDDYAVAFPLYWHFDDPFDKADKGADALFPLWLYFNSGREDYSLHVLWPLYNRKHDGPTEGWRLWPLYADWRQGGGAYQGWYAWPLGWRWGNADRHSRLLLPLFYQQSAPDASSFVSLPFGWHEEPDREWSYLFPVGFHQRDTQADRWYTLLGGSRTEPDGDRSWYAVPALSWGNRNGADHSVWAGGGLYHSSQTGDSSSSHLLPFYYRSQSPEESLFVSLPYSRHRDASGSWSLVPPLWFRYQDEAGAFSLTPLYMWGRDNRTGEPWSAIPPLYYHRDDVAGDTFLSPLFSTWSGAGQTRHTLLPPGLTYYRESERRSDLWTLGGLGHFSWGDERGSTYLFPFFYESATREIALSPLWASWSPEDHSRRVSVVPPLLSWMDRKSDSASLYLLLGLAKLSGGEEPEDSWILPLFYRSPANNQFLSLPYARWRQGDMTSVGCPLLLSSYSSSATERDLILLMGLYGRSWSTRPGSSSSSYLFPVYAAGDDYFLTLLAGRWKDDTTFTYFPTPLFGWRSGATRGSWLFPLYCYSSDPATRSRDLFYLPWGRYHADASRTESSLFPLYGYKNTARQENGDPSSAQGRQWHILYLAAYENGSRPLTRWNRNTKKSDVTGTAYHADNRFFPVWHYSRTLDTNTRRLEKEFSLLFFLQDYWRKTDVSEKPETDYTRTRILWRLLHYERDHDVVSLDVFPAITYDRNGASLRKVSFLWRGFRYERKDGQKAVDLLFLPVWRTRWAD
jgi:hypothetical protein